jgi:hypothetical protein
MFRDFHLPEEITPYLLNTNATQLAVTPSCSANLQAAPVDQVMILPAVHCMPSV